MPSAHLLPRYSLRALVFSPFHDLHVTARALLIALDGYRSAKSPQPFPSQPTLARDLNVSVPTVRAAIKSAIKGGWLTRELRMRVDGGRTSDLYELHVPEDVLTRAQLVRDAPTKNLEGGAGKNLSGGGQESLPEVDASNREKKQKTALSVVSLTLPATVDEIKGVIDSQLTQALDHVAQRANEKKAREQLYEAIAALVFAYSAAKWGHDGTQLDPKRLRRLVDRLRENGGNVHEMLFAADGALKDAVIAGRARDSDGDYLRISTVFRDKEQVERLARRAGYRPGRVHPMAAKHGLAA